jgi:hypothetical protein
MPRSIVLAALLLSVSLAWRADPGYYVVTVYDNEGQRSVEYRHWTVSRPRG